MNFMQALRAFYDKRFDYHSRSRRSEYWWAQLACFGLTIIALTIDTGVLGFSEEAVFSPLLTTLEVLLLIPTTTLTTRRLHDVGLTGWAQIPLFLVYVSYVPGFEGFPFDAASQGAAGSVLLIVFGVYCIWLLRNLIKNSQAGVNRYGPNPKEANMADVFN